MEIILRISNILTASKKMERQARVILKIANPFFLKASAPHRILNESDQEFVWSYFCLEKNLTKNSYWQKVGTIPAKNDQYMIKIINYINKYCQKDVILSLNDFAVVEELMVRLKQYKALRNEQLNCVKLREVQSL